MIAKSLVIYFDLGVEVKKMHEYDGEQNQHNNDDQITNDFRDSMVGLRNKLLIDLRQKLSKQYDSATKAKPHVLKDHPESKISNTSFEESKLTLIMNLNRTMTALLKTMLCCNFQILIVKAADRTLNHQRIIWILQIVTFGHFSFHSSKS